MECLHNINIPCFPVFIKWWSVFTLQSLPSIFAITLLYDRLLFRQDRASSKAVLNRIYALYTDHNFSVLKSYAKTYRKVLEISFSRRCDHAFYVLSGKHTEKLTVSSGTDVGLPYRF